MDVASRRKLTEKIMEMWGDCHDRIEEYDSLVKGGFAKKLLKVDREALTENAFLNISDDEKARAFLASLNDVSLRMVLHDVENIRGGHAYRTLREYAKDGKYLKDTAGKKKPRIGGLDPNYRYQSSGKRSRSHYPGY